MGTCNGKNNFDLTYLRSITGGDFVFERDLLQMVIRDLDDGLDNLQFAWQRNDLAEIRKIMPQLKSLSAVTGLENLSGFLLLIEQQLVLGCFRTQSEDMLFKILAGWKDVRPELDKALSAYR